MPHSVFSSYPSSTPTPREPEMEEEPRLLHDFFARAARRWPGNIAIETPPSSACPVRRTITYAELDRRSDALANYFREFVVGECVVAILLPRTTEHIYLAQLAVLKAGGAYVCIDPTFPDVQVRNILDDSRPVALLTDSAGAARARRGDPELECVLDVGGWTPPADGPVEPPAPAEWLTPRSLAYVIYTSGTTGRPKGVMIEHGSIANLVRGELAEYPVRPDDRVGQSSSCAYDSSVEEIMVPLAAGATLVVMDDETTRLGPDLIPWLRAERITIFVPPPTLLRATGCDNPGRELPALRRVHVGGEPLPQDVADRWGAGRCLVNDYGPTECSVVALRAVIGPGDPITIGRPLPGLRAWVLNDQLEEVAVGQTGELCLGGVGLARGYMNDPAMTARKFPAHPRLGRIYRTGDLVHRDAAGNFFCHGRIDTQVKVRGYRIELEAIEARLAECPGVRVAACRVQGDGPAQQIIAFIVPTDAGNPPHADDLRRALRLLLPEYMVPSHFGVLDRLPTTVGGKLNRRALPALEQVHEAEPTGQVVGPRDALETKVAGAVGKALGLRDRVSVEHDFFTDLGGDSLRAAVLISLLRDDPATAALAVRDVYEARTAAALADRARAAVDRQTARGTPRGRANNPFFATLVQTAWLLLGLVVGGPVLYLLVFHIVPDLTLSLGLGPFLLATPLLYAAGAAVYSVGAVGFLVLLKKTLIGRYRPGREPVWGAFYVRNWVVHQAARLVPWRALEGTVFLHVVLRALGARIGKRVHIHRGVNLYHGGWDLLDIGDDVTIGRDAALRLVDLEDGQVVVGPIVLGDRSTVEARASLAPGTRLEPEGYLTALSLLPAGNTVPRGERWAGVPAVPVGDAPPAPAVPGGSRELSPVWHGVALLLGQTALRVSAALSLAAIAFAFAWAQGVDAAVAVEWLLHPMLDAGDFFLSVALVSLVVPLTLVSQCLSMRALGRIPEGVISRWSPAYVRVWLKTGILDSASDWLNGTLLWRVWLRGAGMKVGRNTELSTIFDTVPELVEIGAGTFFADGIYLAAPVVHRGTVTLARTRLGDGVFLGNYAVIPAGRTIPDGVLLGVCTVADETPVLPGTSWFGHPSFELPKREVVEADPGLTHEPSWVRYSNRVVWELLRFTMPVAPMLLVLGWFELLGLAESAVSLPVLVLAVVPALDFGFLAALCLLGLGLKWVLLGRVRPATHPLWSCWCSRWDFNYTAFHYYSLGPLSLLEGTVWLNWYFRALGVKVGRGVVLGGDALAFAVDPDMLEVGDGATVSPLFQAHTFEDRVLKIDRVKIGAGATVGNAAVLLYGADIGDGAHVAANSVVMKHERLQPDRKYAGCPTRLVE
ncbi:MAG: lgrD 2 [Gemmataceae bacterium]|nr:lgrD 2 [Gemmataceae bacterium]